MRGFGRGAGAGPTASAVAADLLDIIDGAARAIDSRPSDAIALAVRAKSPIFVSDLVMERAAIRPDEDMEKETLAKGEDEVVDDGRLSAFKDFVNSLDLDDLDDDDD